MDAQTKKALQSLKVELPKLHQFLGQCRALMNEPTAEPPAEFKASLKLNLLLLQTLLNWADPPNEDLTATVKKSGQDVSESGDLEEMSDEEAMAMLEAANAPTHDETPTPPPSGELSDEEALKLLAAMDEPLGGKDLQSKKVQDPPPSTNAKDDSMSDDEAYRLLAAMDEPAPPPANKSPSTSGKAPTPSKAQSADDEALAMLSAMGGLGEDDHTPATKGGAEPAQSAKEAAHHTQEESEKEENLTEIEEFSKNDFASDPDMMNDFGNNSDELMETLDQTILQLEQNPRDRETIESIFRAAHTLKGAAGMFGFKAIERVMHRMENLFEQVRKGRLVPNADTIDVVFQGLDILRQLMDAVKAGKPSGVPTVPIVKMLELASVGKYTKGSSPPGGRTNGANQEKSDPLSDSPEGGVPPAAAGDHAEGATQKKTEQTTIRVDLERLDMLVNLVGELVIDRTRFASLDESIRTTNPQLKAAGALSETVQIFGRHMNEIHEIIMKIRMVPIGNAFNKFTRVVRDLSRQLNKDITLNITGEDTELDKTLVEQIGDPLIHLIRNSCDHGVETPDVRLAAGKSRAGRISLSARQEGNNIIITIEDDGKGIQVDAVRRKGIERGLISEDASLSKRDIFNLIFEAGFSTAEKVTNVSGRGVGMDVVRKQISRLKGLIDIDSELGKGTTTTIRLPLTLAIVQSLLVETLGDTFAIPLSTVVESVRIKPEDIQSVGEAEVIKRHGKVLPLMHLSDILELNDKDVHSWYVGDSHRDENGQQIPALKNTRRKDRLFVVIVGTADRRFGIVVDQLLHQQEMVIKSMGPLMKRVPCVAGGAVLGNGEVVLVLDVQELEDKFRSRTKAKREIKSTPPISMGLKAS